MLNCLSQDSPMAHDAREARQWFFCCPGFKVGGAITVDKLTSMEGVRKHAPVPVGQLKNRRAFNLVSKSCGACERVMPVEAGRGVAKNLIIIVTWGKEGIIDAIGFDDKGVDVPSQSTQWCRLSPGSQCTVARGNKFWHKLCPNFQINGDVNTPVAVQKPLWRPCIERVGWHSNSLKICPMDTIRTGGDAKDFTTPGIGVGNVIKRSDVCNARVAHQPRWWGVSRAGEFGESEVIARLINVQMKLVAVGKGRKGVTIGRGMCL